MVENEAISREDFQIQTDRIVVSNQPDIVVINKEQKKTVVIATSGRSNTKS